MPRRTRFEIAQKAIEVELDSIKPNILTYKQLSTIFDKNRFTWRLPVSWTANKFVETLIEKDMILLVQITFPTTTHNRYIVGTEFYTEALVTSINHSAYISHYSAMAVHDLTDQVPKVFYVTVEQSSKPYKGELAQDRIDAAFSKPQRLTNAVATLYGEKEITLQKINGKYTNALGVSKHDGVRVTNLERTLIDATVRPAYCGGVSEVMEAYKRAAEKISINKLKGLLKKLDYTYPYHQAIGFYMQASGAYSEKQYRQLHNFPKRYKFYLTYNMRDKAFSEEWQLYYPESLVKSL